MDLKRLQIHATASYCWIRTRLGVDGAWTGSPPCDASAYYKAPWCFAAAGDLEACRLSLAHIEANHLRPDGDLTPIHNQVLLERHPLYPHAYVVMGAILAGSTGLADLILDFMASHRHAGLGAWGDRIEAREPRRFDAISTSSAGLAFLERGRLDEAHGAAIFLVRLLDLQPDLDTEFFTSVDGDGKLILEFPDLQAAHDRHVRIADRFQVWWSLSFPLIFLARYAEITAEEKWLRAARRYLVLLDRSRQAWNDLSAGKAALACAILYRQTGDPGYRSRALRATRAIVSRQSADGSWRLPVNNEAGTAQAPSVMGYEVNTEFALLMTLVAEAVAQRDGARFMSPARMGDTGWFNHWACQSERVILHQARIRNFQWHNTRLGKWLNSR